MLTSVRGLFAASLATGLALSAAPALASTAEDPAGFDLAAVAAASDVTVDVAALEAATPEISEDASQIGAESAITLSANVALTSDYRFRGVSLSSGDPAIQGGFDAAHSSGFYAGVWASSISGGPLYGDMELDIYAGWSGNLSEAVTFDIGALYYLYPTEDIGADTDYYELLASLGFTLGPVETTLGVGYSPEQDSLGDADNLYLYTDFGIGIGETPFSLNAHIGYTDGALAPPLLAGTGDDSGIDWSVGASYAAGQFEIGVAYIGVEGPSIEEFTDDAVVATISASF
ncbi:MAG TPA: TorF family putative porin [Erythrobacter sp.]|nr:TorF family putative porin [Erythrobacter sp.]